MNKKRRKAIESVQRSILCYTIDESTYINFFKDIYSKVYLIQTEEEMAFDNMPENLQGSMRGCSSEEAIECLGNAAEYIEEIINNKFDEDSIYDLVDNITDALDDAIYA